MKPERNDKLSDTLEDTLGLNALLVLSASIESQELSEADAIEFYNIFEEQKKLAKKRSLRLLVVGVLAVLPLLVVNWLSVSLGNSKLITMLSMLYMVVIMLLLLGILLRTVDWILKYSVLRNIRRHYPSLFYGKKKNF